MRIARLVRLIGLLIQNTNKLPTASKFMQGMLFAMGGMLKSEARNYLNTKIKESSDFHAPAPVRET